MAKLKLSLEDIAPPINTAYGLRTQVGALELCYHLNLELQLKLSRQKEDIIQSHRQMDFFHRVYSFTEENLDWDFKLLENRSYRSSGKGAGPVGLFGSEELSEKNWISNKEGFNFFIWFEGAKENVNFTLSWMEDLRLCSKIVNVKTLEREYLNRINKSIRYSDAV